MRVIPGELHALLERCRVNDGVAWERFAGWVTTRGRAILGGVDRLSDADGDRGSPHRTPADQIIE